MQQKYTIIATLITITVVIIVTVTVAAVIAVAHSLSPLVIMKY